MHDAITHTPASPPPVPAPPRRRPRLVSPAGVFLLPVVIDTREQLPYEFAGIAWDAQDGGGDGATMTVPTERGTLASGDYSLKGYESEVAIERKSLADLYSTIGQGRDRFEREMERLAEYEFAAVVVEADESEAYTSPPPFSQLSPKTVARSVDAWRVRYGVQFIFVGNSLPMCVLDVLKEYEQWEADLVMSQEAWKRGAALPDFTWPLWDKLIEIQKARNFAKDRAIAALNMGRRLAEVKTFRLLERYAKERLKRDTPVGGDGAAPGESDAPWLSLAQVKKQHISNTLTRCDGDKVKAAEALGVSLKTVYNWMREQRNGRN